MTTLADFLLARIAEDEEVARAALGDGREDLPWESSWDEWRLGADERAADHIDRHDPARVLAECEAKRRIVEGHPWPTYRGDMDPCESDDSAGHLAPISECPIFRALALPYADHPDYDESWRP